MPTTLPPLRRFPLSTLPTRPHHPLHRPPPHPSHHQTRHASLLRRPKRPYTFTQLITLSDGSTFTHRTTSPLPLYKSTKDTRNAPLWNPSSLKLANVEEDEAGRLRAFRKRFGRGWDFEGTGAEDEGGEGEGEKGGREGDGDGGDGEESLLDLITGFGRGGQEEGEMRGEVVGAGREKGKGGGRGKGRR